MTTRTDRAVQRLAAQRPVDEVTSCRVVSRRERAELLNAILSAPRAEAGTSPPRSISAVGRVAATRRGPGWARPQMAVLVAVVAALVVGITVVGLPGSGGTATANAAQRVLTAAARTAQAQSAVQLRPGQYVYTDQAGANLIVDGDAPAFAFRIPYTRRTWLRADGSGRSVTDRGAAEFFATGDRSLYAQRGDRDLPGVSTETFPAPPRPSLNAASYAYLQTLPTRPDQLRAVIERAAAGQGGSLDGQMFATVGDMLGAQLVPPQLAAALYRVAAGLPGVTLVGRVSDTEDRTGTAVAYTYAGLRDEIIFDPVTGQLLERRSVLARTGAGSVHAPVGTVLDYTTVVRSGVVDRLGASPPGTG